MSSRIFRAIVTLLTVCLILWALNHFCGRRQQNDLAHASYSVIKPSHPLRSNSDHFSAPVQISEFPFVAMDNSCTSGEDVDLSRWTGLISNAPARTYEFVFEQGKSLQISVVPDSPDYDAGFVLLSESGEKIFAREMVGAGQEERAEVKNLQAGKYKLIVGGYSDNCGDYQLTIRDLPPPITKVSEISSLNGANGTVVRWKSFGEVDLSYFSLFRTDENGRSRIAVLRAHGSPASFAEYKFMDRKPVPGGVYELVAVARDGRMEKMDVVS